MWLAVEVFCETNIEPRVSGPETKGAVNPRDLVVSNNFFHSLISEENLVKSPLLRH